MMDNKLASDNLLEFTGYSIVNKYIQIKKTMKNYQIKTRIDINLKII